MRMTTRNFLGRNFLGRNFLGHKFLAAMAVFFVAANGVPAWADEENQTPLWAQVKNETAIGHVPADNNTPVVPLTGLGTDIRFDPSKLDDSKIMISVQYAPPQAEATEDNSGGGTFESRSIRHVRDNVFEADGVLHLAGHDGRIKMPFTVAYDTTANPPKMILEGGMDVNTAQYASGEAKTLYPNMIPVRFHIVSQPLPPTAPPAEE